jgi:hypothetical protein
VSAPWAAHDLAVGQGGRWQFGALDLRVQREAGAWILRWCCGAHGKEEVRHLALARTEGPLLLAPRLADQPVVVRPAEALSIAAEEEVLLFAATPLWVAVAASAGRQPLADLPTTRLPPTWFGPNTRSGELCLAGTRPLEATPLAGPCEVLTPILFQNGNEAPLPVERLRLPLPRLALFRAADGGFWTPALTVRCKGEATELTVGDLAPAQALRPRREAPAREAAQGGVLTALGSVLRHPIF